jgi:hypothetical protein
MNAPFTSRPADDPLTGAIAYVRPRLECANRISEKVRILWAAVLAARDLGASDVIEDEFMRLALDVGLGRDLGRHADETLRHVIRWGILDRNPFH